MDELAGLRRAGGVLAGELGMLLAVVGTLLDHNVVSYDLIAIAFLVGAAAGIPWRYSCPWTASRSEPRSRTLSALWTAALIGTAEYYAKQPTGFVMVAPGARNAPRAFSPSRGA